MQNDQCKLQNAELYIEHIALIILHFAFFETTFSSHCPMRTLVYEERRHC
jgi:hypothetical protein